MGRKGPAGNTQVQSHTSLRACILLCLHRRTQPWKPGPNQLCGKRGKGWAALPRAAWSHPFLCFLGSAGPVPPLIAFLLSPWEAMAACRTSSLLGKLKQRPRFLLFLVAFLTRGIPRSAVNPTYNENNPVLCPLLSHREKVSDKSKNRGAMGTAAMDSLGRRPNGTHEVQGTLESQGPSWRSMVSRRPGGLGWGRLATQLGSNMCSRR